MNSVYVGYEPAMQAEAEQLAKRLHFKVSQQQFPRLVVGTEKVTLLFKNFHPLYVDFTTEKLKKRKEGGKKQGLIKACKPIAGLKILDLTAGWGRDAALLAEFGACVQLIERNPVMAILLQDGLKRIGSDSPLHNRLSMHFGEAKQYLAELNETDFPDVIYIDPMHPEREKSALVKKDMQALQFLLGADEDADELVTLALEKAKIRIVVKWPQRLPPLRAPHMSIPGKTVRFDVFLPTRT